MSLHAVDAVATVSGEGLSRSPLSESGRRGLTPATVPVRVVAPERMNLLGLILASLVTRRLADPAAVRHARALRGEVMFEASGMKATLRFEPDGITVLRDPVAEPRAQIRGTLVALLDTALQRRRARSVLSGKLRVRGNPLVLWHLLALVRG